MKPKNLFIVGNVCKLLNFNLQGDPGPMVPKGNICKHKNDNSHISANVLKLLIELTDSKTPKAKKAKKEDRDCTVKKEVGKLVFLF